MVYEGKAYYAEDKVMVHEGEVYYAEDRPYIPSIIVQLKWNL